MSKAYDVKIGDYCLGRATIEIGHKNDWILLELIDKSIEKWKGIVFHDQEDHGTDDCPLCKLFHPNNIYGLDTSEMGKWSCKGCPIEQYTGKSGCDRTPYHYFYTRGSILTIKGNYICDSHAEGSILRQLSTYDRYQNYRKYIAAANHMLSFLYELRLWYINTHLK